MDRKHAMINAITPPLACNSSSFFVSFKSCRIIPFHHWPICVQICTQKCSLLICTLKYTWLIYVKTKSPPRLQLILSNMSLLSPQKERTYCCYTPLFVLYDLFSHVYYINLKSHSVNVHPSSPSGGLKKLWSGGNFGGATHTSGHETCFHSVDYMYEWVGFSDCLYS